MDFKIDFSGRSLAYTNEEVQAVVEVMKKADPLTQGVYLDEFEKKFSEYIGSQYCFGVSTGTAALELAAMLCQFNKGDEVIMPAHTFCASAIPFARTGVNIVWADIDPETWVVSADTIKPLITDRTSAIVVVHLYGLMVSMHEIMELVKSRNIYVIEDCAQSIGSSIGTSKAGTFGDFGCFSFHSHKNLTTLGEGGMLVVKDKDLAALVPGLRHNGLRGYDPDRPRYWVPAMSNVDFDIDGLWPNNFCISEVQCVVGIKLLDRIEHQVNLDRNIRAQRFLKALSEYPELIFQHIPDDFFSNYHLLAARFDGKKYGKTNHDLIEILAFKYGIKCVVQYCPLYRYPMFVKAGFSDANCPNTEEFFDNMISFPFHHWMSDEDFNLMINYTKKALDIIRGKSMD